MLVWEETQNDGRVLELARPEIDYFVFGGDFCDKGSGDIRIGEWLVNLKQRYPEVRTPPPRPVSP